jgi:hypothetical protein
MNAKLVFRPFLLALTVGYLSGMLHEAGHWAVLQAFGREPLMGFNGIVQLWDTEPRNPKEWVKISYPNIGEGWLHLGSTPESSLEWIIMLIAGPIVHPALILMGILSLRSGNRAAVFKEFELMLTIVNGLRFFSAPLGYLTSSKGDFYFIGFYAGLSEVTVMFPFVMAELAGFLLGLYKVEGWKTRVQWLVTVFATFPIFRGLTLIDVMIIRPQVNYGNPLFASVFGWSLPVFVAHLLLVLGLLGFFILGKSVSR